MRGIETRGGRIAGVVTEHGRITCDQVVLAGGVWSQLFCRPLDLRLPQLKVLSSVMLAQQEKPPEVVFRPPGLKLDHGAEGAYRECVAGAMEGYRDSTAISMAKRADAE